MGRPLRAVYANTTYSTGAREMSDVDMDSIIAPIVLTYIVNNPSLTYGTTLRVNTAGTYDVLRGSAVDTRNASIGTHPSSNSTISTYTVYQNERVVSPLGATARPVHYVASGSENRIVEMTDAEIYTYIAPSITQTMITGGQGSYFLGLTTTGAPATGTWVSYATLIDTYYNGSNVLTSDSYTLWQRTTGTAAGTVRPLKLNGSAGVVEMSDAEIQSLAASVGEYIRNTGIGQYAFQPSAPTPGTWASRGAFTNNINNLVDTGYQGVYTGNYNSPFTATYTGSFSRTFTTAYNRNYAGTYTMIRNVAFSNVYSHLSAVAFTGTWTNTYAGGYTNTFNTSFVRVWVGQYTRYVLKTYTGLIPINRTTAYSGTWTKDYTGTYSRTPAYTTYVPIVAYNGFFTASYLGAYSHSFVVYNSVWTSNTRLPGVFAQVGAFFAGYQAFYPTYYTNDDVPSYAFYLGFYTGPIVYTSLRDVVYTHYRTQGLLTPYSATFIGYYATGYTKEYIGYFNSTTPGYYNSSYVNTYTGNYTMLYTGAFTGAFTSSYTSTYSSVKLVYYNSSFTRTYTGSFTSLYVGNYTSQYFPSFTGLFTGTFNFPYTGSFTGTYTGVYTGLTVQAATSTTTYTLWVRTA